MPQLFCDDLEKPLTRQEKVVEHPGRPGGLENGAVQQAVDLRGALRRSSGHTFDLTTASSRFTSISSPTTAEDPDTSRRNPVNGVPSIRAFRWRHRESSRLAARLGYAYLPQAGNQSIQVRWVSEKRSP